MGCEAAHLPHGCCSAAAACAQPCPTWAAVFTILPGPLVTTCASGGPVTMACTGIAGHSLLLSLRPRMSMQQHGIRSSIRMPAQPWCQHPSTGLPGTKVCASVHHQHIATAADLPVSCRQLQAGRLWPTVLQHLDTWAGQANSSAECTGVRQALHGSTRPPRFQAASWLHISPAHSSAGCTEGGTGKMYTRAAPRPRGGRMRLHT